MGAGAGEECSLCVPAALPQMQMATDSEIVLLPPCLESLLLVCLELKGPCYPSGQGKGSLKILWPKATYLLGLDLTKVLRLHMQTVYQ